MSHTVHFDGRGRDEELFHQITNSMQWFCGELKNLLILVITFSHFSHSKMSACSAAILNNI